MVAEDPAPRRLIRSEFEDFVDNHDLIIVNVDGTTASGSTWDYGLPLNISSRTQEGKAALTGMQFSKYTSGN